MSNPLSLHLPDRDVFTDDEYVAVRDLNPSSILVMAYSADKGAADQTNALVRELGIEDVLVRCYADRIQDLDPAAWADECLSRVSRYHAKRVHCIPANEMNLDAEGYHGDLDELMQWLQEFGKAARDNRLFHQATLHLPAPWAGWVGENEQRAKDYWDKAKESNAWAWYREFDAHCYGAGFDLWKYCSTVFGREPYITEWNQCPMSVATEAMTAIAPRRPAAAYYFTLRWVNYSSNGSEWRDDDVMSLMKYPELYAEFKAQDGTQPAIEPPQIIVDPIEEAVTMTRDQARRRALADVWNGEASKAPYNPESAMGAFWDANYKDMGSACGPEWPADDGSVWQGFALGLWVATPGDPWTVEQAA